MIENSYTVDSDYTIKVVMYLRPLIHIDSEIILGSVYKDDIHNKYHTDVNPDRLINGPFSDWGQELEPPIQAEYDAFIDDCIWLTKEVGFTVLKQYTSTVSKKSEYIIVFGIDDKPCGSIVYELRISDHSIDARFPEDLKDEVLELLKLNKVLDGEATKAGIDFAVEKVTVGGVKSDSWDKAFDRLYNKLRHMRNALQKRNKRK